MHGGLAAITEEKEGKVACDKVSDCERVLKTVGMTIPHPSTVWPEYTWIILLLTHTAIDITSRYPPDAILAPALPLLHESRGISGLTFTQVFTKVHALNAEFRKALPILGDPCQRPQ